MENNESEKQNFKFPERWGVCAIILLPFLFFVSAIAYITEFSNSLQYFFSFGILSIATWVYYEYIKMSEVLENVIRDEKTLKLLDEEREENRQLKKRVMENEKEIENMKKFLEDTIKETGDVVKKSRDVVKKSEDIVTRAEKAIEATKDTDKIIKENERLKEENEKLKKEKEIR